MLWSIAWAIAALSNKDKNITAKYSLFLRIRNNVRLMRIEEAIVYVLASAGRGMKTEQIAREINEKRLFVRRNNVPVDGKMVYAVVMSHPGTFVKSEGLIRLMI